MELAGGEGGHVALRNGGLLECSEEGLGRGLPARECQNGFGLVGGGEGGVAGEEILGDARVVECGERADGVATQWRLVEERERGGQ